MTAEEQEAAEKIRLENLEDEKQTRKNPPVPHTEERTLGEAHEIAKEHRRMKREINLAYKSIRSE